MRYFFLMLSAILIFIIMAPIGFLWQCVVRLFHLNEYLFKVCLAIDQAGNVVCSGLFNDILIKKNGYKFGNEDETISSVLGKNKKTNTLKKSGKILSDFLNKIDNNHVEEAAEKNV